MLPFFTAAFTPALRRIVYDRSNNRFTLYADAKLMKPEIISRIRERFALSAELTSVERDFHYQGSETPAHQPLRGDSPE